MEACGRLQGFERANGAQFLPAPLIDTFPKKKKEQHKKRILMVLDLPGKLAALNQWGEIRTIIELRSFMGFCIYYSGYVRMYADLSRPLHKMLQVGKFDGRKGSKKKISFLMEAGIAYGGFKRTLLGDVGLLLIDPNKGFVLRTDTSENAVGAVQEQVRCDGTHM